MLRKEKKEWESLGAIYTAQEIARQPQLWKETYDIIKEQLDRINQFFTEIEQRHGNFRLILSGAGTSAFIGETVVPYLKKITDGNKVNVESIATTNIVSNPDQYLQANVPTILVSFARSGNSPESVATIKLAEQLVANPYHIVITCNPEGQLAQWTKGRKNALLLMMPELSNDQGFAMTSSFTCMMLGLLLTCERSRLHELGGIVSQVSACAEEIIAKKEMLLDELAHSSFHKIVYLGSGVFGGLAREASLKMLELTGGKIPVMYDTSLGFRHGPKSIMDDDTVIVVFLSNDPYTRKYDLDILREIYSQQTKARLVGISDLADPEAEAMCDLFLTLRKTDQASRLDDIYLTFPFVMFAQLLALKKSIKLGFSPDNPCPSGSVNRVVQGVVIYDF